MPTLRQKVDSFCKDAGAKVESTDKLRAQITTLKSELTKSKEAFKSHMKQMKAASKTAKAAKAPKAPKMTAEEKGQQKREKAVTKELAEAGGCDESCPVHHAADGNCNLSGSAHAAPPSVLDANPVKK